MPSSGCCTWRCLQTKQRKSKTTLNNISLKEEHNEMFFLTSETGRLKRRHDNCAHTCEDFMSPVGGQNLVRCSEEDSSLILGKSFSQQAYRSTGEVVFITENLCNWIRKAWAARNSLCDPCLSQVTF